MILADIPTEVTSLGGLVALATVVVLHKMIADAKAKPREDDKLNNLKAQSEALVDGNNINRAILAQLEVSAKAHSKYAKFGKKQSKKINRKLGSIHDDVLVVKQQTIRK